VPGAAEVLVEPGGRDCGDAVDKCSFCHGGPRKK